MFYTDTLYSLYYYLISDRSSTGFEQRLSVSDAIGTLSLELSAKETRINK